VGVQNGSFSGLDGGKLELYGTFFRPRSRTVTNVYFHDYENRVKIENSSSNAVAEYAYDALGRRIRVIDSVASTTTLYYYNADWQCLAEYDATGQQAVQLRYFVYGNYIDEPLVMRRQSDGKDYFYGHDHLYSTVVLLDDSGSVVERCEYDAYGTVLVYTDDGNDDTWFTGDDTTASASAKGNPYSFTGRQLDVVDSGGLVRMHYRHRDYDVYAGRFLQHDPFSYIDGLSLYQYATTNPIVRLDPKGTYVHDLGGVVDPPKRVSCNWMCGPDITFSLVDVLFQVDTDFQSWDEEKQKRQCDILFDREMGILAWGIIELKGLARRTGPDPVYGCPSRECARTVGFGGNCYNAHAVNYALWGRMCSLCNVSKLKMRAYAEGYKRLVHGPIWRTDLNETMAWAEWAYSWDDGPLPRSTHTHCSRWCPDHEVRKFTYFWAGSEE